MLTAAIPAALSGILVFVGLLVLPLMQAAQPDEGLVALSPADPGWWVAVVLLAAQTVALLWAKQEPRLVLGAVVAASAILAVTAPQSAFSLTAVAIMIAVFLAVAREPLRALRVVLPIVIVVVAGSQAVNELRLGAHPTAITLGASVLQASVVVGIPVVIGLYFAAQRDARAARASELLAVQRERDALIQTAIARERMAMSRELHDIAAHHMSGISLLASAISKQVDADPASAKKSAEQVRAQSKSALDDLRRVIGLLRDDAEGSRSVESLASVHELVDLSKNAGLPIEFTLLERESTLGTGIGPLAQLVVFRTVQEALANVAAHAPGAKTVVRLDDRNPKKLIVEIINDGSHAPDLGPGGGFGLVGMQERADLIDAELQHGPTDDGGFTVRLTVKREAE